MNKMKYNKIKFALSAAVMGIMAGNVQAIELIRFSNGNVADANDVNHNFDLLEKRIDDAEKLKAPVILDGRGIQLHTWVDFDASVGWASKTFVVTHSEEAHDKEVRTYERTPNAGQPGSGTINVTRQRTLLGDVIRHDVLSYGYSAAERVLVGMARFDRDTVTLNQTIAYVPSIKLQHDAMGEGLNWATASMVTSTLVNADPVETFAIDNRSLLKIEETIDVLGFRYSGCQKLLIERSGNGLWRNQKIINWYCPNNMGLVKQVFVRDGIVSKLLEFDQASSNAIVTALPSAGNGGTTTTLTLGSSEP